MAKKSVDFSRPFFASLILFFVSLVVTFFLLKHLEPSKNFIGVTNVKDRSKDLGLLNETKKQLSKKIIRVNPSKLYSSESQQVIDKNLASNIQESATTNHDQTKDKLFQNAMRLIDLNKPKAAKDILEDLLQKDPSNDGLLVELGLLHLVDFRDLSKGRYYLERALEIQPDNIVALSELITLYEDFDQSQSGIRFMEILYNKNYNNHNIAYGLGHIYSSQGHFYQAVPYLEVAAESGNYNYIEELAHAQLASGDNYGAIDSLQKIINLYKESYSGPEEIIERSYIQLITALIKVGQVDNAKFIFRDLKQHKPGLFGKETEQKIFSLLVKQNPI